MRFLSLYVQKSFLTKNYFLTSEMNFTTRGPLYTCLVCSDLMSRAGKQGQTSYHPVTQKLCKWFSSLLTLEILKKMKKQDEDFIFFEIPSIIHNLITFNSIWSLVKSTKYTIVLHFYKSKIPFIKFNMKGALFKPGVNFH